MSDLTGGAAPAPEAPTIDTTPPAVGAPIAEPVKEEKLPTLDETLNAAWDKAQTGVDRGDNGKFVAANKPADPEPELAVQPTPEPVEPAKPAIDAPQSWTADKREHWAKLPPDMQSYILQRESESHKAITSQGARLKSYEPIEGVITQYRADLERRGLEPARGIATLFEAQRMLDANPMEGLVTIGLGYGIDLRAILSGQQAPPPTHDPRLGQLEQKLAQIEQNTKRQQEEQQQRAAADLEAMVSDFKKDKPHFDAVEDEMMGLIPVVRQKNPGLSVKEILQKAYDKSVFANETVRERILADQRKAADEKRKSDDEKAKEELKKRAEDAARSAKVNVKSGTSVPTPKTMDDTLQEIARRAYG